MGRPKGLHYDSSSADLQVCQGHHPLWFPLANAYPTRMARVLRSLLCMVCVGIVAPSQPPASRSGRSGLDLSSLDAAVRPQDDLYRYANGGWIATAEIPDDRVYRDAFTELGDKVDLDL